MNRIIPFPVRTARSTVPSRRNRWHWIEVRITDQINPRRTQWYTQWAIQETDGFGALLGLNDNTARAGASHGFWLLSPAVPRFLREADQLIARNLLQVRIDRQLFRHRAVG
jgi:hypothetical protein